MKSRFLALSCVLPCLLLASCNRDPRAAARGYVETGNKFYKAGKLKQADIMYRKALGKDKLSSQAYYRWGIVLVESYEFVPALRAFERAVELQSDKSNATTRLTDQESADAANRLAELYLAIYAAELQRTRDPKQAQQWLGNMARVSGDLLAKDPRSYEGLRLRGLVKAAYASWPEKDALPNRVKDELAKLNDKADEATVRATLRKGAIEDFAAANQVRPNEPKLLIPYASTLEADGRSEEAEKIARQLISINKSGSDGYNLLYGFCLKRNRVADAEAVLKEEVAANPQNIAYRLQLAAHYVLTRDRAQTDATLNQIVTDFRNSPEMRERVGDFYFRLRDYQLAYDQYDQGAKEQPKRAGGFQKRMVEALIAQKKYNEAMALVERVIQADPKDDTAKAMRASLLLQTGSKENIDRAVVEMQTLVSKMSDNPVLRFNYGRALLSQGQVDHAAVQFKEAADKGGPGYMLPRLALAEIAFNKGEYGKALERTDEILKYEPQNPMAHMIRARSQYMIGDAKKARTELEELVKTSPALVDAQFQLALLDISEKNYKQADATLERMFKETGDTRALLALSDSLCAQQRFDEAIHMLQAELDKNPKRGDLRLALGNASALARRWDQAVSYFEQFVAQYPLSAAGYLRLGEAYRIKGDIPKATANWKKANELMPNDYRPLLQLGLLADMGGDRRSSKEAYEKVLKLVPDEPYALNNLAFALAEEGTDLDRALGMAQRAKQRMPDATDVADTLGWIYLKKSLSDQALQVFEEIVKKQPTNPVYRYHLALALFQKGDKIQAKREASAALQNKPTKADETRIRDLLSKLG